MAGPAFTRHQPYRLGMDRRRFLLTSLAGALAAPLAAVAQQPAKIPRVGYLYPGPPPLTPTFDAFRMGLRDLGWIEGENLVIHHRFAELPAAVAELLRLDVAVIVALGTPTAQAAKQATSTVPIVMISGDPVRTGLVTSLARPGGNVTGIANLLPELRAKSLQILMEGVPRSSRIGFLMVADNPASELSWRELEAAAPARGATMHRVPVRGVHDIERAFADMARERLGGLIVAGDVAFISRRQQLVDLAAKARLPTLYSDRAFVEAGGLMSYAQSAAEVGRLVAKYVDRILNGARAADLPVEQTTKLEFVIDLKTAKALGLTIPPSLLLRADQVIE